MMNKHKNNFSPSREDVLPNDVLDRLPKNIIGNISYGCQVVNWMSFAEIIQVYPSLNNPYDVMERFAETCFREEREAVRLLGKTPVDRFLFTLIGGEKIYEVVERNGLKAVVESYYYHRRGDITWESVRRRKASAS